MEALEILALIIKILLVAFSVFLIVVVLLQAGAKQGLSGAIAGGAEQMFGKKKGKGMEGLLVKLTKVSAVCFMALSVFLCIMNSYWI